MVGRAVALAAGGVAAAAVFVCALLIYKMVAAKRAEDGGKRPVRAEPHVYNSPRLQQQLEEGNFPVEGEAQSVGLPQTPNKDRAPTPADAAPAAAEMGLPAPRHLSLPGQALAGGEVTSCSREMSSHDESVWQCPTREPATGEEWSIGTHNVVYCPSEFFISGDVVSGRLAQPRKPQNKAADGAEEQDVRHDFVSAWVEDPNRFGWSPGDVGDPYAFKIDNPLFAQNPAPHESPPRGDAAESDAEDPSVGGCRHEGGERSAAGNKEGSGGERAVESSVEDFLGGSWKSMDREGPPTGRQDATALDRVMESWDEDSEGKGWKPVARGGTPSGRRDGATPFRTSASLDQSQGGWRPDGAAGTPSGRKDDVIANRGDSSWAGDPQGSGWNPEEVDGQPLGGNALSALGRPPVQAAKTRDGNVARNSDIVENPGVSATWSCAPEDDELPISCSLPADFDFVRKGSGGWGGDSCSSETFAADLDRSLSGIGGGWPPEHEAGSWPLQQGTSGWPPIQDQGIWPPVDQAGSRTQVRGAPEPEEHGMPSSFTFDQAAMEQGRLLGESVSTMEEGRAQEDADEHSHTQMSITIFCQAAVPSLRCLPDYCTSKLAPQCPEPLAASSVSSDEWSHGETMSPVVGQSRFGPDMRLCSTASRTGTKPHVALQVHEGRTLSGGKVPEGRKLVSPFFGTTNSYFSRDDQMDGYDDDSGLAGYPPSNSEEIDLCVRSQDAIKRLDGSIWLDNALFDPKITKCHRIDRPEPRPGDVRQGHATEVISM